MPPFDLDCRDRAPQLAPHALRALARLTEIAEQLGMDERAVLLLVAERLAKGRQQYGTLDVSHDPRCFSVEALEKAADGLVYAAVALLRGRRA